jgi:competence protein ComEA
MLSFNRSEQIVLILLSGALLVGAVVTLVDHYDSDRIPEFDVHKDAIAVPSQGAESATSTAPDSLSAVGARIDLNTASAQELERLPRIGPRTAQRIVEHRTAHGPFRSLEDLKAVRGIGPKTLEGLRPFTTIAAP